MKTSAIDFVLSIAAGLVLTAASVFAVLFVAARATTPFLGTYHVVADFILFLFFFGLFSGILVRLLLRLVPLQRGDFPMDHRSYTYWKLLVMVSHTGRTMLVPVTPLAARPLVLKLFGARIGTNTAIAGLVDCPFLVTFGDGTIVGAGSQIAATMTANERIVIGDVTFGSFVTIGMNAVILPNVEIGDHAVVEINAVVMPGTKIPAGERWRGNPARKWLAT